MLQEAKNAMERTLYTAVSPRAYENIKQVAKVGTVGGVLTAAADFVPYALNKTAAYAAESIEKIKEICDPKNQFPSIIGSYNFKLDPFVKAVPSSTLEERWGFLYGPSSTDWEKLLTIKSCVESHGGNPDSIAHMGKNLAEVVNWYISVVPEFPENVVKTLIVASGIGTAIAVPKIVNYVKSVIKRKREN